MRIIIPICVPLLSGCAVLEMAQTWQLDRLRVLAVQATPAEPQPDETVTLKSLTYSPPEESVDAVVWFGCLGDDATSFGCTIDPELVESLNQPPENPSEQIAWFTELQEAGLLGIEPDIPPTWAIPTDALDSLEEADKVEGLSAFMNLTAIPSNVQDDSDVELVYKRLPVSLNPAPNQNPIIQNFMVNEIDFTSDDVVTVTVGETLILDIEFADGAIEEYSYTNPDTGETEIRTEKPYISWYTESGTFSSFVSIPPYTAVDWIAPDTAMSSEIIATVRDRRGGMDWIRFSIVVEVP